MPSGFSLGDVAGVSLPGVDVAALAEEDDRVGPVPGLDDVQAFTDLALQIPVAQVAGQEDGPLRPPGPETVAGAPPPPARECAGWRT
jgi:hypothetical protein